MTWFTCQRILVAVAVGGWCSVSGARRGMVIKLQIEQNVNHSWRYSANEQTTEKVTLQKNKQGDVEEVFHTASTSKWGYKQLLSRGAEQSVEQFV